MGFLTDKQLKKIQNTYNKKISDMVDAMSYGIGMAKLKWDNEMYGVPITTAGFKPCVRCKKGISRSEWHDWNGLHPLCVICHSDLARHEESQVHTAVLKEREKLISSMRGNSTGLLRFFNQSFFDLGNEGMKLVIETGEATHVRAWILKEDKKEHELRHVNESEIDHPFAYPVLIITNELLAENIKFKAAMHVADRELGALVMQNTQSMTTKITFPDRDKLRIFIKRFSWILG